MAKMTFEDKVKEAESQVELLGRIPVKAATFDSHLQEADARIAKLREFALDLPLSAPIVFTNATKTDETIFDSTAQELAQQFSNSPLRDVYTTAQGFVRRAREYHEKGDYEKAEQAFGIAQDLAVALKVHEDLERVRAPEELINAVGIATTAYSTNLDANSHLIIIAASTYLTLKEKKDTVGTNDALELALSLRDIPQSRYGIAEDQLAVLQARSYIEVSDQYKDFVLNGLGKAYEMYRDNPNNSEILDQATFIATASLQLAAYSTMSSEARKEFKDDAFELQKGIAKGNLTIEQLTATSAKIVTHVLSQLVDEVDESFKRLKFPKNEKDQVVAHVEGIRKLIEVGEYRRAVSCITLLAEYQSAVMLNTNVARKEILEALSKLTKPVMTTEEQQQVAENLTQALQNLNNYSSVYATVVDIREKLLKRKGVFTKAGVKSFDSKKEVERNLNQALEKAKEGKFDESTELINHALRTFMKEDSGAVSEARKIQIEFFSRTIKSDKGFMTQLSGGIDKYKKSLDKMKKDFEEMAVGRGVSEKVDAVVKHLDGLQGQIDVLTKELDGIEQLAQKNPQEAWEKRLELIGKIEELQKQFNKIVRYTATCFDQLASLERIAHLPELNRYERITIISQAGRIQNAIEDIGYGQLTEARKKLIDTATDVFNFAYKKSESPFFTGVGLQTQLHLIDKKLDGGYESARGEISGVENGVALLSLNLQDALEGAITGRNWDGKLFTAIGTNVDYLTSMIEKTIKVKAKSKEEKYSSIAFQQFANVYKLQRQAISERNEGALNGTSNALSQLSLLPGKTNSSGVLQALNYKALALKAFVAEKMSGNEEHELLKINRKGNVELAQYEFERVMDDVDGRYFVNGEKVPYVGISASFLYQSIRDFETAATSVESGWFVAGERKKQEQVFDGLYANMKAQRSIIEVTRKLKQESAREGETKQETAKREREEYVLILKQYIRPALDSQLEIARRQGDERAIEKLDRYIKEFDIDALKANVQLQFHVIEKISESNQLELTRNFARDMVDLVGGLVPGYGSVTEYVRTGTVHGETLAFDLISVVPYAGQLAKSAKGLKLARTASRSARASGAGMRGGLAVGYAEYAATKAMGIGDVLEVGGRAGKALNVTETAFNIGAVGLSVGYAGYATFSELDRNRQLGIKEGVSYQTVVNILNAALPAITWGGMGLAQRYTRPRTTPPGIGGGGRRLTRAVQFLTEAKNPFGSVERLAQRTAMGAIDVNRIKEIAGLADEVVYGKKSDAEIVKKTAKMTPEERTRFKQLVDMMYETKLRGERLPTDHYVEGLTRVPMPESFTSWAEVVRYTQQVRPRTVYRGQRVKVIENAKRIVAIGDVHGDADGLRAHLQEAGVIDQNGKLSPNLEEGTQIVFMGDYLDRGPTSMQVLDMVRDLQAQGAQMGVQVHGIMGNHEQLFLKFFDRYSRKTQAEVEAAIADTGHKSKTTQRDGADWKRIGFEQTYQSIIEKYGTWENAVAGMQADGTLNWIRSLDGALIIDGNYFTHGGPNLNARSVGEIDASFQKLFSDSNNPWTHPNPTPNQKRSALGDHTHDYVGVPSLVDPRVDKFRMGLGTASDPKVQKFMAEQRITDVNDPKVKSFIEQNRLGMLDDPRVLKFTVENNVQGEDVGKVKRFMEENGITDYSDPRVSKFINAEYEIEAYMKKKGITDRNDPRLKADREFDELLFEHTLFPGFISWDQHPALPGHMTELGINHIYVGHSRGDNIRPVGRYTTCLDGSMSGGYKGGKGGILDINPMSDKPVRVVERAGEHDFSNGRSLRGVLDNDVTKAVTRYQEQRAGVVRLDERTRQPAGAEPTQQTKPPPLPRQRPPPRPRPRETPPPLPKAKLSEGAIMILEVSDADLTRLNATYKSQVAGAERGQIYNEFEVIVNKETITVTVADDITGERLLQYIGQQIMRERSRQAAVREAAKRAGNE